MYDGIELLLILDLLVEHASQSNNYLIGYDIRKSTLREEILFHSLFI